MKRLVIASAILASALGAPGLSGAVDLDKTTIRAADGSEVPVEVARPAGKGPFPPVLFIHAKRGYEGDERAHVRELAEQGFLVVAPDWQGGRFIERWPSAHNPDTEMDVEAGLDYLKSLPDACRQPVGIVGLSRGPYTRSGWPPSAAPTSPPSSATTATCRTPTRPNPTSCSASRRK